MLQYRLKIFNWLVFMVDDEEKHLRLGDHFQGGHAISTKNIFAQLFAFLENMQNLLTLVTIWQFPSHEGEQDQSFSLGSGCYTRNVFYLDVQGNAD